MPTNGIDDTKSKKQIRTDAENDEMFQPKVLHGTAAPSNTLGKDGDLYILRES